MNICCHLFFTSSITHIISIMGHVNYSKVDVELEALRDQWSERISSIPDSASVGTVSNTMFKVAVSELDEIAQFLGPVKASDTVTPDESAQPAKSAELAKPIESNSLDPETEQTKKLIIPQKF
jgi:hypothetical protein